MRIRHAKQNTAADSAEPELVQPSDWNDDHVIELEPGDLLQGLKGDKGDKGDQGPAGAPGADGLPGAAGAPGKDAVVTVDAWAPVFAGPNVDSVKSGCEVIGRRRRYFYEARMVASYPAGFAFAVNLGAANAGRMCTRRHRCGTVEAYSANVLEVQISATGYPDILNIPGGAMSAGAWLRMVWEVE